MKKKKNNFVCIQETRLEFLDSNVWKSLWDDIAFDRAYLGSRGLSDALLCSWKTAIFRMEKCLERPKALETVGVWNENIK